MGGEEYQPGGGEERRDFHASRASWQDAIAEYCSKRYDTPTGHAYPNGVAFFLHTLQSQAEQAGDRITASNLATLNDTYALIAFPFLDFDAQRHYRLAFSNRGWLRPDDTEEVSDVALSDEQYHSLMQLLEKANIPEMSRLTGERDIPLQTTAEGRHILPVAPVLANLRRRNAFFRTLVRLANKTEEERRAEAQEKHLPPMRMRLIKPIGHVIRVQGGFSADSNREKQ